MSGRRSWSPTTACWRSKPPRAPTACSIGSRRCAPRGGSGSPSGTGVLVKSPKPTQDRRFDLPSLGPQTVEKAARAKLAGIAVAAGETVIAEPSRVADAADRAGLFVVGMRSPGASMTLAIDAPNELTRLSDRGRGIRRSARRGADARARSRAPADVDLSASAAAKWLAKDCSRWCRINDLAFIGFGLIDAAAGDLSLYPRCRRCGRGGAPGCPRHHRQSRN